MIAKQYRLTSILLLAVTWLASITSASPLCFAASSPPTKICPLASSDIKVHLVANQLEGRVSQPVSVKMIINPAEPPSGFYYSSLVEVLQSPLGTPPEVLTGVPEISIKCFTPGSYLFNVRVNLIAKSSCGGAKASILMEDKVTLNIKAKTGF
jgi:hypothetical protein